MKSIEPCILMIFWFNENPQKCPGVEGVFTCLEMQLGNYPCMETHPQDRRKWDPSSFEKFGQHLIRQKGWTNIQTNRKGWWWAFWGYPLGQLDFGDTPWQDQFWKKLCNRPSRLKVLHVWEGVLVRRSNQVKMAVIATMPPWSVFFGYHVQRGSPRWIGTAGDSCRF